jgi:hypothetical protein
MLFLLSFRLWSKLFADWITFLLTLVLNLVLRYLAKMKQEKWERNKTTFERISFFPPWIPLTRSRSHVLICKLISADMSDLNYSCSTGSTIHDETWSLHDCWTLVPIRWRSSTRRVPSGLCRVTFLQGWCSCTLKVVYAISTALLRSVTTPTYASSDWGERRKLSARVIFCRPRFKPSTSRIQIKNSASRVNLSAGDDNDDG